MFGSQVFLSQIFERGDLLFKFTEDFEKCLLKVILN